MNRRLTTWLRRVGPVWLLVGPPLAIYVFFEVIAVSMQRAAGGSLEVGDIVREQRDRVLVALVAFSGAYRAWVFHPIFRSKYYEWLKQSPWTAAKPLPLGPVHLVLQDALMALLVVALLFNPAVYTLKVFLAFLLPYLGLLSVAFFLTGPCWMGYVMAFGLGAVVRLLPSLDMAAGGAALFYMAAFFGLRASLAQFPWAPSARQRALLEINQNKGMSSDLGWPFEQLRPNRSPLSFERRHRVLVSLLVGWWLHAAVSIIPGSDVGAFAGALYSYALMACTAGRFATYFWNYRPPISLWGRIWTGRWIIPGYDQMLAAPLCALIVGVLLPFLLDHWGTPPEYSFPLSLTMVLLIVLEMGPSLNRWQLTGNHRIVPVRASSGQSAQGKERLSGSNIERSRRENV